MDVKKPQILLSNDDGILSPGLWAAAEALSPLGYVTVAAPREQHSGAGRSVPAWSDGEIKPTVLKIGEQEWECYAVGGSPAQAVQVGAMIILKELPDLVVSGINYGENPGTDVSLSGTVGAALEGASYGIPSLAVSLQLRGNDYFGYSRQVDFSAAAAFTRLFARQLLESKMPPDVHVLNVNVPASATADTPWRITHLSRHAYFVPYAKPAEEGNPPRVADKIVIYEDDLSDPNCDVTAFTRDKVVSVTPLSLNMTSRVDLADFEHQLRANL
jgi:5'-nucleotidase